MVLAEIDDLVFASALCEQPPLRSKLAPKGRDNRKRSRVPGEAFKTQYDEVYDKLITPKKMIESP